MGNACYLFCPVILLRSYSQVATFFTTISLLFLTLLFRIVISFLNVLSIFTRSERTVTSDKTSRSFHGKNSFLRKKVVSQCRNESLNPTLYLYTLQNPKSHTSILQNVPPIPDRKPKNTNLKHCLDAKKE